MFGINNYSFDLKTVKREQFISITEEVKLCLRKAEIRIGTCKVFIPHTTAGLMINENADPDVVYDLTTILDEMIPQQRRFLHSEGNSDAHAKSAIIGCHLDIPIDNNRLMLGQWQGIYFCEFDGPRTRKVIVQCLGEK